MHAQALEHYGQAIRCGHKTILQSLPRLLTLYFEFGSRLAVAAAGRGGVNQKLQNAQTKVRMSVAMRVRCRQRLHCAPNVFQRVLGLSCLATRAAVHS